MLHPFRIRFAPPLVIEEADLHKSVKIIGEALSDLDLVSTIPPTVREPGFMGFIVR